MPFAVKLPENDAADPSHVPPINDDKPFWNQVREEHLLFTISYFDDDHPERNVEVEVGIVECEQNDRSYKVEYLLRHHDGNRIEYDDEEWEYENEETIQAETIVEVQEYIRRLGRSSNARRTFKSIRKEIARIWMIRRDIRDEEFRAEVHDDSLPIHYMTDRPVERFATKAERDEALRAIGWGHLVAH
jgi:hypothetical protein